MATDITDMSPSALVAPARTTTRPKRIASSAAMKKVLSPSSLTKMSANAAVNPDLASAATAAWPNIVFRDRNHPAADATASASARIAGGRFDGRRDRASFAGATADALAAHARVGARRAFPFRRRSRRAARGWTDVDATPPAASRLARVASRAPRDANDDASGARPER
eukprot:30922-Pelagococcus_subviridis.AAC.4